MVHKFLPKQIDLNKVFKTQVRNVLKGTHLPMTITEIKVGYLTSPYFKNIYLYLAQSKLPPSIAGIRQVKHRQKNIYSLTHYC